MLWTVKLFRRFIWALALGLNPCPMFYPFRLLFVRWSVKRLMDYNRNLRWVVSGDDEGLVKFLTQIMQRTLDPPQSGV